MVLPRTHLGRDQLVSQALLHPVPAALQGRGQGRVHCKRPSRRGLSRAPLPPPAPQGPPPRVPPNRECGWQTRGVSKVSA